MSINQKNRAIAANSSRWGNWIAFWKVLVEYANDYLAGNKYKRNLSVNNTKQK